MLTGACRPSGARFPGMRLSPRQLAEALPFLCEAPAVNKCGEATSAGNSLGMPQIRKPLSTAELLSPVHRYRRVSTVGWVGGAADSGENTGRGRVANACGCELGHILESRGCLTYGNMAGGEISHRLRAEPGNLESRQGTHPWVSTPAFPLTSGLRRKFW